MNGLLSMGRCGLMVAAALAFAGCVAEEGAEHEQHVHTLPDPATLAETQAGLTFPAVTPRGYVHTTADVWLFSGPGESFPLVTPIPKDAKVFVNDGPPQNTSWFNVSYRGHTGWAMGEFLEPRRSQIVYTLPTTEKLVSLTFDAGADAGYTEHILDVLKKEGIIATFGITGKWANLYPHLVKRITDEGHPIINHSWSHGSFTGFSSKKPALTYEERNLELWKTHAIVLKTSGANTKPYFRPPYGDLDNSVLTDLYSRGYNYTVMWSCDSLGWKGLTAEEITARSIEFLKPGAIYLYHVGSQSQDGPALESIIQELRARGYGFSNVNQFLK